jgi:RNA polymerase sigma factor (sigma-70 family)
VTGATPDVEDLLRDLTPRVLGAVVRRYGDLDGSEDAVQEALVVAATQWAEDDIPGNPGGWLYRVACRRMTDRVRSEAARRRREDDVLGAEVDDATPLDQDDSLALLVLCCHPSLKPAAAIALTLRAVGGLTTAEIAAAFLVPETTMGQRISRAKQRIRDAGAGFAMPTAEEQAERLRSVLHVLYLIFNEGYTSSTGPTLARRELSAEAIRLTRLVRRYVPDDPEVAGLLALMLLTDARRAARTGTDGELIPLDEQDRSLWDPGLIAEGAELIGTALSHGRIGAYQLQAMVAAAHDQAPSTEATDWEQILGLYGLLQRMTDNPMVALNRAIAAAMVHGPDEGLALLEPLDEQLAGSHRLDAVRAHLHERAGDTDAAITHYRAAAARTTSLPEQRYLVTKAAALATARRSDEEPGR